VTFSDIESDVASPVFFFYNPDLRKKHSYVAA